MHPFRFGVQLSRAPSARAWRDTARKIEDLGYSTLFIPDHFDDQFGPLAALTVAAESTTTLRVGSLVFGNDYRHPVVLAKEIATLDLLSEGRVEFGLGAGWMTSDYDQAGLPLDPPATRIDRMAESLAVMRSLWSGGVTTVDGDHYRVRGLSGTPSPARPGGPPVIIGGGGRRVLRLAAAHADIVGVNPNLAAGAIGPDVIATAVPAAYDERLAWLRQAAGARFDELELQCLTFAVQVVPDGPAVLERLAALFGMSVDDVAGSPVALIGSVDGIVETLEERRRRWGFSYVVVHEAELDAFAPVVARLAGS
jgi:probable F420-dependent oxidoreductase